MLILGIETSCDETGAAVIRAELKDQPVTLLSNVIATSLALHAETGGIIPEIAAREQIKYILPVINQALHDAKTTIEDIDAIAVTYGPGLIGSLLVGVETAKTLSYVYNKPLIPVNHLYGHIYANWIHSSVISNKVRDPKYEKAKQEISRLARNDKEIVFPALALVVSGGHTDLVLMKGHGKLEVVGGTRDDAAGEAFDKIGRLLGLPYPGGVFISALAEKGDPKAFALPRPMIGSGDFNFSFSGLKTAVLNLVKKNQWDFAPVIPAVSGISHKNSPTRDPGLSPHNIGIPNENYHRDQDDEKNKLLADLCASVEEAIIDIIVRKTLKAAEQYEVKSILLGGGVAANSKLQERIKLTTLRSLPSAEFFAPPKNLCTDNAAMIAAAAFYNHRVTPWQEVTADPELYF